MWLRFLALACLVGAAFAGPVQRPFENRSVKCCNSNSHSQVDYKQGQTYVYGCKSQNIIDSPGGHEEIAAMTAIAELQMISSCEGVLKFRNSKIQQDTPEVAKERLKEQLELPLYFINNCGKLEAVYPHSGESKQSLNMKKSFLSSFVTIPGLTNNKSQNVKEEDGFGECETEYIVQNNGVIFKKKKLSTCTKSPMLITPIFQKKFSTSMLLKEDSVEYTQEIKDRVFQNISCNEYKKIRNLSKDKHSLELKAHLTLNLIEIKPSKTQLWQIPDKREEIYFEMDESRRGDRNVAETIRVLKDMCSKSDEDFGMSVGKNYMDLVSLAKKLEFDDLQNIHKSLKDKSLCSAWKLQDIFVDAVATAATVPCVKLIIKLLDTDDMTPLRKKLSVASLALMMDPTEEIVTALKPLVRKDQSTSILTAIATLIRKLCLAKNCRQIPPVNDILEKISEFLGSNCSSDDYKQITIGLRFLGNMGYHGEVHDNIIACIKDRSKPTALRLAAIHSCRNTNNEISPEFLQILEDDNEDTEVKIACMAPILQRGEERQMKQLQTIIKKEKNMQVSSYMDTYIKSTKKSHVQRQGNLMNFLKTNNISPRTGSYWTHSKNMQFSTYNKVLNTGGILSIDCVHEPRFGMPISIRIAFKGVLGPPESSIESDLVEIGLRTEGTENIQEYLMELKEKIPVFEKLLRTIKQKRNADEWKEELKGIFSKLSLDKVFGESMPKIFLYVDVLKTEVFSISTRDLSSIKEILKLAEFLSALAHGKKIDFSHTLTFMNSQLLVPSVTGRCYDLKMTGSATVGLIAETKVDIMNSQRNSIVHVHTKPRLTVNMDMTAGLDTGSNNPPRIKLLARSDSKHDVDFKIKVHKDGIATVGVDFPSEKPAFWKLSTDVVRIDPINKNEVSIYGLKETKMSKCIEQLKKPLGMTLCAKIEAPKHPYLTPCGNLEVAWKTFDAKSYLFRFELPKKGASSMKYKASLDTPGSKISRLFEAALEVKDQRDQKDVLLELKSPFETIGGSCTLINNEEDLKASMELHSSKTQIASVAMSSRLISTRARKMLEISGAYSILNKKENKMNGTFAFTKGRKHHVSFDVKSNTPASKPIAIKGTLMKEGLFELSPKNEFKISSEIFFQSPIGDIKIRKTMEKRSKQSQALSANFGIDYQLKGQEKNSLSISGTSQKNSNKINTVANIVSTQYPAANIKMSWNLQKESQERFNNDIKLQYGTNPNEKSIIVKHNTYIPKKEPGHCSTIVEIPHLNIRQEMNIDHHLDINSDRPIIRLAFNISNKKNVHVNGGIDFRCESKIPLKASGRLEMGYQGRQYIFEDKIEETSKNLLEGQAKFLSKNDEKTEQSEIRYKYRKLSSDSKVHHEIESSVQTPLFRSPINGKASIELNSESWAIAGHVGPQYSIEAHLKEYGVSHISLKLPMIESKANFTKKDSKSIFNAVLNIKSGKQHALTAIADLGTKKKFEIKYQPDYNRAPEKQIVASISGEKTSGNDIITGHSRLQIFDMLHVSLVEVGHVSLLGDHDLTLEIKNKNNERFTINCKREVSKEMGKHTVTFLKNSKVMGKFVLEAKQKQIKDKKDFSIDVIVTSADDAFKDIHICFKTQITGSGSSRNIQTSISFQRQDEVYATEWHSDVHPNGLEVKAQMQTPYKNYEKNAAGFSLRVSDSSISSAVNIACSDKNKIFIQTKIETKDDILSLKSKINLENETIAVIHVGIENKLSQKSFVVQLDTKTERVCEIKGSIQKTTEDDQYEVSVQLPKRREMKFQGINARLHFKDSSLSLIGNIEQFNNEKISWMSEIKVERKKMFVVTTITSPYKDWKNVNARLLVEKEGLKCSISNYVHVNGHCKADIKGIVSISSKIIELKIQSNKPRNYEILANVKYEKNETSFLITANILKDTSSLLSTSLNALSHNGGKKLLIKTEIMDKSLFDMELSKVPHKDKKEYSLNAKGLISLFHVIRNKNKSVSSEWRACSELKSKEVCYRLRSFLENWSLQTYLEKSVGRSNYFTLGKLHLLLNSKSTKAIVESGKGKYGLQFDQQLNENDLCYFNFKLNTPSCESQLGASMEHNKGNINIKVYASPNTDDPTSNLTIMIEREKHPDNHKVSWRINFAKGEKSQLISANYWPVGRTDRFLRMYYVQMVMHPGSLSDKTWTLKVIPNFEQETAGKRSLEYQVYSDKEYVGTLSFFIQSIKDQKSIGYQYNYSSPEDNVKKGGLNVTVSRVNGAKAVKVSYSNPSAKYEVQTSIAAGPNEINFSLASSGQKMKEINIIISDSGIEVELRKSANKDSVIKCAISVNKSGHNYLQSAEFICDHRQNNCLYIQVGVKREEPGKAVINIKYNNTESRKALVEVRKEFLPECRLLQELPHYVRKLKDICVKNFKELNHCLQYERKCNPKNVIKEYTEKIMKKNRDILTRIQPEVYTAFKQAFKKLPEDLQRSCKKWYGIFKEKAIRYWPAICETAWYCSDIKSAFENFDSREARIMIDRKMNEIKQFLRLRSRRLELIYPSDIINYIKSLIDSVINIFEKIMISTFGKTLGGLVMYEIKKTVSKIESHIKELVVHWETDARQKLIDIWDEFIKAARNYWSSDENVQKAKVLVLDAKDKMIKAWRNREDIAKYHSRRVENSIKENWKKLVDNHVEVSKYDTSRGEFSFSVRPPLWKPYIENKKQEIRQLLRKFTDFLNKRK